MAVRDRYESMEKRKWNNFVAGGSVDFPDICLPDRNGRTICLSELKGNTYFYPSGIQPMFA